MATGKTVEAELSQRYTSYVVGMLSIQETIEDRGLFACGFDRWNSIVFKGSHDTFCT